MHLSRSLHFLPPRWLARGGTLLAMTIVANGCAAQGPVAQLAAGEVACGASALARQVVSAECLMQRRQAYEQALGDFSVQVLR